MDPDGACRSKRAVDLRSVSNTDNCEFTEGFQYVNFPLSPVLRADGNAQVFVGAFLGQNVPMVGLQDLEEHGRRRRPWTRGLGAAALREYEHLTARRVRQLADTLEEQGETSLEKWFDYFAWVYSPLAIVVRDTDALLEHRYDLMSDMAYVPPRFLSLSKCLTPRRYVS